VVVVVGVVVGVLLVGGSEAQGETVQLEPVASSGSNPFMPPLTSGGSTPPSTVAPAAGTGPFGGTGDNSLCDRDRMAAFLTDPAHGAEAREWARVVGISSSGIAAYVADLVPTVLARDTAVTNNSFVDGRAVPYQAVLQAGTAVLVDSRGALVARCESGNPLAEPRRVANPVYTGPRWPRFNPTVIVIIVPARTPVLTPDGTGATDDYDVDFDARSANVQSTESLSTVTWTGTLRVNRAGALTGRGRGTLTFAGTCFREDVGYSDVQLDATFELTIAGTTAGQRPNRTYQLTFTPGAPTIGNITGKAVDEACRAGVTALAPTLVNEALGPLTVPAARGTTPATSGVYNLVITLS
jgi:hypothetical protein